MSGVPMYLLVFAHREWPAKPYQGLFRVVPSTEGSTTPKAVRLRCRRALAHLPQLAYVALGVYPARAAEKEGPMENRGVGEVEFVGFACAEINTGRVQTRPCTRDVRMVHAGPGSAHAAYIPVDYWHPSPGMPVPAEPITPVITWHEPLSCFPTSWVRRPNSLCEEGFA